MECSTNDFVYVN